MNSQFAKETTEIRNKIDEEQRVRVAADQDLKRELGKECVQRMTSEIKYILKLG